MSVRPSVCLNLFFLLLVVFGVCVARRTADRAPAALRRARLQRVIPPVWRAVAAAVAAAASVAKKMHIEKKTDRGVNDDTTREEEHEQKDSRYTSTREHFEQKYGGRESFQTHTDISSIPAY